MSEEIKYAPVDLTVPQFTLRAILTGMVLGGVLSLCNVYTGLKIGWGFNMSIAAALLSYGFWNGAHAAIGSAPWGKLENNINQTAASAAASISSAGLVAPIPALTMITGYKWGYVALVAWTASVALVGVVVAIALRRQMLVVDKLPFPMGIATAETLNEMYARGKEAMARVKALVGGGVVAGGLKIAVSVLKIKRLALPGTIGGASMKNLTFSIDPSLLMVGVGVLSGIRAGASMLLGAAVAWLVVGPYAIEQGWITPGADDKSWFSPMVTWLLWPGVVMMVTASLTSFAFSWRSVVAAMRGGKGGTETDTGPDKSDSVPRRWFMRALLAAMAASVILQVILFGIGIHVAVIGVILTFLLAVVAARVAGETNITPVGAMGKVTQLSFGLIAPADATANLMAANVTGGAASQAADLLHDMKAGLIIGASPRLQALAQGLGVLAGALCGSAAYLILVPDPSTMLLTDEWQAPAVAQWKAVAELLTQGLDKLPPGTLAAMAVAATVGISFAVFEKILPKHLASWVPSPTAMGIAFCISGYYSISMFIGGLIGVVGNKYFEKWSTRFLIVIAAGAIAGHSLAGFGLALKAILTGG